MNERDKIAAIIRALRAKTVENGCTEGEALAAAEKLADLLQRYNFTLDEAELRATPFEHHTEQHEDAVGERLWKIADSVAHVTGCKYWISRAGVFPIEINFFGFAHEVEVARYLLEICAYAMRSQHTRLGQEWALVNSATQRRKILPFLDGMADRLARRIRDLKPAAPTGTGLVVLRSQLVEAAMPIKTDTGPARRSRDFEPDYEKGQAAADKVALNRGLGGPQATAGYLR